MSAGWISASPQSSWSMVVPWSPETAVTSGASPTQAEQIARDVAAANGYSNGVGGATVSVTSPTTGLYLVQVSQAQSLYFSGVNLTAAPTVSGQTYVKTSTSGPACILALDPSDRGTLVLQGTPSVTTNNCFVGNNSASGGVTVEDQDGTLLGGHATLTTSLFTTEGYYDVDGNSALHATTVLTAAPATPDPFANLSAPTPGTCQTYSGGSTLTPGTYCGGISVNSQTQLTLAAGTYIINGGDFSLNGGAGIDGSAGVTLIFMNGATFHFNGGGTLALTAPSSGTYKGVAIYVDRNMANANSDMINGNATITINGALYAPTQYVGYAGTAATMACTQLIAYQIEFKGTADFGYSASCPGGVSSSGGSSSGIY